MVSFEKIKNIPKIDLHINFLSSISETLAFDLTDEKDIADMFSMNTLSKFNDYEECLSLPLKLLHSEKNIRLAINDLIKRLKDTGIIYGELFLDLPLYNKDMPLEYLLNILLDEINREELSLSLVLCTCDKLSKEENLQVLDVYKKYSLKGVNGVYFKKDKITNIYDYIYLFDKLIREEIPYIIPFDSKMTNQTREIYTHAKRIIYTFDEEDLELLKLAFDNDIMLSFSISKILQLNNNLDIYKLIYKLIENNYLVTINSEDMTILNTDIINEYCLLFNNCDLKLLELIKLLINSINNLLIDDKLKNELIMVLKDKSNEIL